MKLMIIFSLLALVISSVVPTATAVTVAWSNPTAQPHTFMVTVTYRGPCTGTNLMPITRSQLSAASRAITIAGLEEFASYLVSVESVHLVGQNEVATTIFSTLATS